ncbi:hypothetical protein E2562_014559 [Oryza meyeriana var. granulata]|uniref:Uncharacterized protein n=1 Tax=Oryza meyeriana var. granulata TaxID=110450 RepID=A0A6G1EIV1_9ORYZ|nr:hypothetical protein E2562_014559 [Oryza meyeriana var. granulata]
MVLIGLIRWRPPASRIPDGQLACNPRVCDLGWRGGVGSRGGRKGQGISLRCMAVAGVVGCGGGLGRTRGEKGKVRTDEGIEKG